MNTMTPSRNSTVAPEPFVSTLEHKDFTETFLTIPAGSGEAPSRMFDRMQDCLKDLDAGVIRMEGVGLINTSGCAKDEQRYCCDCENCSLSGFSSACERCCPVSGLHIHTVSVDKLRPVWLGGLIVGTYYEDDYARHCYLVNVLPETNVSPAAQTRRLLERWEAALEFAGMVFTDVVRTWYYLDGIFDWYDEFNRVRDQFFRERGVFDKLVPASTGIGGENQVGAAVVGSLYAVQPKTKDVKIFQVPSPLQCPALDYGSSFARAVEMDMPDHRKLFISGTASIEPGGATVHLDDIDGQIDLTMDVVLAIMESRKMEWSDVTRAIAYIRDAPDLPAYARWCERKDMPMEPVLVIHDDVCRDDLLFEIELDAVQKKS